MGLDSYWADSPKGPPISITLNPPVNLCGGMLSGNGNDSFRGKVYASLIQELTGISLYQEWIAPAEIKRMAETLELAEKAGIHEDSESDLHDLVRMFKAHAEAGHGLLGWW